MRPERYFYHMELSNIRGIDIKGLDNLICFTPNDKHIDNNPVFNSYANIKRRNYSIYVACGGLGVQNGI